MTLTVTPGSGTAEVEHESVDRIDVKVASDRDVSPVKEEFIPILLGERSQCDAEAKRVVDVDPG